MADIPVENRGNNPLHIKGAVIQPGETRILPEDMVPPRYRPGGGPEPGPAPAPEAPDEVLQLLDQPVGQITPELSALSDTDLARLEEAEQAGKTRKTLMAAFQEERLRRAGEGSGGASGQAGHPDEVTRILAHDAEQIPPILSEVANGDLTALYEAEAANDNRETVLAAITAEGERRNG